MSNKTLLAIVFATVGIMITVFLTGIVLTEVAVSLLF